MKILTKTLLIGSLGLSLFLLNTKRAKADSSSDIIASTAVHRLMKCENSHNKKKGFVVYLAENQKTAVLMEKSEIGLKKVGELNCQFFRSTDSSSDILSVFQCQDVRPLADAGYLIEIHKHKLIPLGRTSPSEYFDAIVSEQTIMGPRILEELPRCTNTAAN